MAPMVAFPIDLFAHCSDSQSTKHAIDLHSQGEWDIASPPLFRLSRSGASEECRSRSWWIAPVSQPAGLRSTKIGIAVRVVTDSPHPGP